MLKAGERGGEMIDAAVDAECRRGLDSSWVRKIMVQSLLLEGFELSLWRRGSMEEAFLLACFADCSSEQQLISHELGCHKDPWHLP